jgi:hypothetical protein
MDNAGTIEEFETWPDREFFGNAYYNNTVGYPPSMGSASINLTADPFTDAASGDFSLNNDAGGGAVLRAITETLGGLLGSTTSNPFNWLTEGATVATSTGRQWMLAGAGAISQDEGVGGGGGGSPRLINGGLIS